MIKTVHIIILFLLIIVLTGFYKKEKNNSSYYQTFTPPGTLQVDSNLFVDKTEITNFSWLEYMYWIERTFGKESYKYKSCLPNREIWLENDSCLSSYSDYYLDHPAYRDYPVVGISQKQALDYCKWRSDRVFEILLIQKKILEFTPYQNECDYFSIENYFNGDYWNIKPNINIKYVPNYRLPTEKEWKMGKTFFDDYNRENLKTCKKKYCSNQLNKDSLEIVYNVVPCIGDSLLTEPFHPTQCYQNKDIGFHFYGNVSEWLSEKDMIIGGNWKDTSSSHFNTPIINTEASTTVGFRTICEWKEYKIVN